MLFARKTSIPLLLPVLALLILGCAKKTLDPETAARTEPLLQIQDIYEEYVKKNHQPPKQLSDLQRKEFEVGNPGLINEIKAGKFVVVWGVDVNKDPSKILAYEKDAPTNGGWAITAGGKTKNMSADELQAALK